MLGAWFAISSGAPCEERRNDDAGNRARRSSFDGGLFHATFQGRKERMMANHLTPEELSKELGIDRQEVIKLCIQEAIPIYQGKIDKTLFQAQLEAVKAGQA
jgi:hypothetical protein